MTLEEIKKVFRYGWIAKDGDCDWHWFSKEPELLCDESSCEYYWSGENRIEIGIIEGTEDIICFYSLMEMGE